MFPRILAFPKKIFILGLTLVCPAVFCCIESAYAGEVFYRSVRITAEVNTSPRAIIRLNWNADSTAKNYTVSRKLSEEKAWIKLADVGTDTIFTDTNVEKSKEYEYQIIKFGTRNGREYSISGYISAGIEISFDDKRGTIALVIDSLVNSAVANEIATLTDDLEGDGWRVSKIITKRSEVFDGKKIKALKREIQSIYDKDTSLRAVFLLGRVPVPYSGRFAPDDHTEHLGAWPADCYYGDVSPASTDERWSDLFVSQITAEREANRNRRVDGKFDQSEIPSDIELAVGRVDFFDLPLSGKSEIEMIRDYLRRNHAYRHKLQNTYSAACFWDKFDLVGEEMFAQSAYCNATSLFGSAAIYETRWLSKTADTAFQFGFAAGPGSYTSCWDIGDSQAAARGSNAVFCAMMGSYFGDWDSQDNLLRSVLGGGSLAVWWSGRPQWLLHRCAVGQPIGTATLLTINNDGILYDAGRYARGTHIALMGDPTLRFFPVAPPKDLLLTVTSDSVILNWKAPTDDIYGYAIYRDDGFGFKRLNVDEITTTRFAEKKPVYYSSAIRYMVRAIALQHTYSGSFLNPSQGIIAKDELLAIDENISVLEDVQITPQPVDDYCYITINETDNEEIEILNILGETIAKPEHIGAGRWQWNAHGISAGAYIVKIISNKNIKPYLFLKR
ncbi:MAG: hypothetical protein LC116_03490 [Bacteroidetes bacterium]|nr:hypothetical protein [Bacteroidota bacterium]MCZ2132248.1 hypothetical protein [Bacteroidota bacterium]